MTLTFGFKPSLEIIYWAPPVSFSPLVVRDVVAVLVGGGLEVVGVLLSSV